LPYTKREMKKIAIFIILGILIAGCNPDEETDAQTHARNIAEIEEYLAENNLEAEMSETGLFYNILAPGGAERPILTSNVNVDYRGRTIDDDLFDAGVDIEFPLNGVITGWGEGMQLIGAGGEIDLYIPARLGYGNNPPPNSIIEAGGVIIFNVKLNSFTP